MTMPNDMFTKPAEAGRDTKGRIARGNGVGCGNPFARRVAALRSALLEEVDEEKFRRMVRDLVEMALDKDLAAIKLVFHYVLGKPTPMVNPDDLDRLEFEQLKRDSVGLGDLHELTDGTYLPVALGNVTVKAGVGGHGANVASALAESLRTGRLPGEDRPRIPPLPEAAEEEGEEPAEQEPED